MGGSGSGSHYHWWRGSKKQTVQDCRTLDANRWMREGILKAGLDRWGSWRWTYRSGNSFSVNYEVQTLDMDSPRVRLFYSWTLSGRGEPQSADYHLRLTTTRPRFGGLRWWFLCPLAGCGRRVSKLHLPPGGRYFGCRHCYDLTYTSCQESRKYDGLARFLAGDLGTDLATAKELMRVIGKRYR